MKYLKEHNITDLTKRLRYLELEGESLKADIKESIRDFLGDMEYREFGVYNHGIGDFGISILIELSDVFNPGEYVIYGLTKSMYFWAYRYQEMSHSTNEHDISDMEDSDIINESLNILTTNDLMTVCDYLSNVDKDDLLLGTARFGGDEDNYIELNMFKEMCQEGNLTYQVHGMNIFNSATEEVKEYMNTYEFQKLYMTQVGEDMEKIKMFMNGVKIDPKINKEYGHFFEGEAMGFFSMK